MIEASVKVFSKVVLRFGRLSRQDDADKCRKVLYQPSVWQVLRLCRQVDADDCNEVFYQLILL